MSVHIMCVREQLNFMVATRPCLVCLVRSNIIWIQHGTVLVDWENTRTAHNTNRGRVAAAGPAISRVHKHTRIDGSCSSSRSTLYNKNVLLLSFEHEHTNISHICNRCVLSLRFVPTAKYPSLVQKHEHMYS